MLGVAVTKTILLNGGLDAQAVGVTGLVFWSFQCRFWVSQWGNQSGMRSCHSRYGLSCNAVLAFVHDYTWPLNSGCDSDS